MDEEVTKRQYQYLELSSEKWLILEDLVKVFEPSKLPPHSSAVTQMCHCLRCYQLCMAW